MFPLQTIKLDYTFKCDINKCIWMKIETDTLFSSGQSDIPQPNKGNAMWAIQQKYVCTARAFGEE